MQIPSASAGLEECRQFIIRALEKTNKEKNGEVNMKELRKEAEKFDGNGIALRVLPQQAWFDIMGWIPGAIVHGAVVEALKHEEEQVKQTISCPYSST